MPGPANGGRSGGKSYNNKKDNTLVDTLKGACPAHRKKDLDKLVKSLNGDEEKIKAKIEEWWEEPAQQEEVWEDVNKKNAKKKPPSPGFRGGGGRNPGPGRGRGYGRTGGGGRGGGRERGGRSGERGRGGPPKREKEPKTENGTNEENGTTAPPSQSGVPVPVTTAPALKGAWGARAAASTAPPVALSTSTEAPKKAPQPKPEDIAPPPEENPLEVGILSQNDPTPSGMPPPESKLVRTAVPPSCNVWATKGSAHLIQAEKPKPPAPVAPLAPAPAAPIVKPPKPVEPEPISAPVLEPTLESGLPSVVTGATAWGTQPAPAPQPEPIPLEIPPPSPAVPKNLPNPIPSVTSVEDPVPISPEPKVVPPPSSPAAPANVLNMGQWETGDDTQNLDFGFGSFGADNDEVVMNKSVPSVSPGQTEAESAAAAAVSPARPPPGLSLGGMPPMPESAVMVHELENKMESASLNASQKDQTEAKPMTSSLPAPPVQTHEVATPAPMLAAAGVTQQSYSQYGMPGMYNYNAAGSGFVGMTPAGPVLAAVPQPGKPQAGGITNVTVPTTGALPQQGLYATHPPPAPSSGNAMTENTDNATATAANTAAGIPPGMPGAIPYANPALHYGQHQFYMGQHQGGIGYNYGYGQFAGVAQGGFGYQQVMGQSQGYGAPHYDDHTQQATSHHSGGSGGYQKNSGGGYRGRNNHHSSNQYQSQYNPQQHGGYGGQPYAMGYHGDHFSQRGGYGPGAMGDPYGMQQGMHSGGFQDDDHQKGKKGGRNNSSLQQFQPQGPPHQLGGQQPFALQGQGSESAASTGAGGGWSNQGGGWSGGATSWQGS